MFAEIYEAALRPTHWAAVLERLVERFQANSAILRTFEALPETGGLWFAHRIERWALEEYVRYYCLRDVWESSARARGLLKPGKVFNSDRLLPRARLLASEFYRDFLRRQDIRDLLAFVLHDGTAAPMPLTVLYVFRGHQQRLFGGTELRMARYLAPHLARAVELNFQFAEMRHRAAVQSVALERFGPAMAFFDRNGALVNANRPAVALLGSGDGIGIEDGRLTATAPEDNVKLQQLLARRGQSEGGETGVARIGRPSGKLPFVALRVALPPDRLDPPDARRAHFALLLHDPAAATDLDLDALARVYGLTPAEKRLVQVLVNHGSVKEIFRSTDLNQHTVRSQLKAVLRKTGTRAQAELVRLALTVALPKRT